MKQPNETNGGDSRNSPEQGESRRHYQPRIYVACLASYNNGILHGLWIDAHQTADELRCDIAAMLESSPMVGAEEWAIDDYDGFAGFEPHEYEDLDVVSRVANGVATYGEAFSAYVGWAGTSEEAIGNFCSHYTGSYESATAWAKEVADEHGFGQQIETHIDPLIRPYVSFNHVAFVRDMGREWHIIDGQDGTHVFAP